MVNARRTERKRMCMVQDSNRETAEDTRPPDRRADEPLLTVFLREREFLRRVAAGMGMDGVDAEDVLQDVSVQVLKHAGRFEQENMMVRWLVKTTVNRCLSEHRRRFRHKAVRILGRRPDLGRVLDEGSGAVERADVDEELEIVQRTLVELDPSLLLVVILRYFCDLNSQAIAAIVEMNASTVRSHLREARLLLAEKLVRRGIEPP